MFVVEVLYNVHALKAKISLVYCVNLFGYLILFLVSILCVHVSLW
jgi:hypothetical protein